MNSSGHTCYGADSELRFAFGRKRTPFLPTSDGCRIKGTPCRLRECPRKGELQGVHWLDIRPSNGRSSSMMHQLAASVLVRDCDIDAIHVRRGHAGPTSPVHPRWKALNLKLSRRANYFLMEAPERGE